MSIQLLEKRNVISFIHNFTFILEWQITKFNIRVTYLFKYKKYNFNKWKNILRNKLRLQYKKIIANSILKVLCTFLFKWTKLIKFLNNC